MASSSEAEVSEKGPIRSLNARYYTDRQVFEVESAGLLAQTWQFGCHASELEKRVTTPRLKSRASHSRYVGSTTKSACFITSASTVRIN